MSIILIDKKSSLSKDVSISSQFLNTTLLKKFASTQLNCHPSQLKLYHLGINLEYREDQIIKQGEKIQYLIQPKIGNLSNNQTKKKGILYPDELEKIIQNSKIIVIKSANEENIQKSKQHSLWATTFSNQERLKYFFNHYPHVILMFATNRSFEIKGLARMESEPDRITDKSVWAGVSNIRLGGNFKIKWLRKKPLSLVTIERNLGANFKQTIIKSCDGQQLDPSSCKRLAHFFEVPSEPYYPINEESTPNKKNLDIQKKFQQDLLIFSGMHEMKIPPLPQIYLTNVENENPIVEQRKHKSSSSSSQSSEFQRKNKKIKKQRKKKNKKNKKNKKQNKKHERSSSSSQRSLSDSSDRRSESERRRKKGKKNKKHKKDKKHKKHRT